jgi:sugar (pentulose or hexulose) kinase
VLGVSIHQIENPMHTAVWGTALPGFIAMGFRSIEKLSELIRIKRVFEPDMSNRTVYDKMYLQYRELHKQNKKVFAAPNAG